MKYKFITLSLLLAGATVSMSAQSAKENYYTPKWTDNIFMSLGGGIHAVENNGFNKIDPHITLSLGKYITPTWGIRAQANGAWQSLCQSDYHEHGKTYVGGNIDAMLNLSTLFAGVNTDRMFHVYAFAGPYVSGAKAANAVITVDPNKNGKQTYDMQGEEKWRTRWGASAGLGLKFNFNPTVALDIEARGNITPSVFGNVSEHFKAEGKGILTAGLTWTFGGRKFAKVSDRVIEKEVVREVVREVPKEVVKEVVKETSTPTEVAIFFKINKADIRPEGMVNIKLIAKAIKANPKARYRVAGYADKATGTPAINQPLSERRAENVYNALIAEGVNPDQIEKVGMGGTENFFGKNFLQRVVIMEVK